MVERDFPWSSLHSSSDSSSSFRCSSSFSVSIRHSPSSPPSSVSLQRAPSVLTLPTSEWYHLAMHPAQRAIVGRSEWMPSLSWASFLEFYIVLVGTSSNLPFRADPLAGNPIALFIESHRHTKRLATGLHPRDIINSSSDLGSSESSCHRRLDKYVLHLFSWQRCLFTCDFVAIFLIRITEFEGIQ